MKKLIVLAFVLVGAVIRAHAAVTTTADIKTQLIDLNRSHVALDAQRLKDAHDLVNSSTLVQCTIYGKCKRAKSLANILSWELLVTSVDEDKESLIVSELNAQIQGQIPNGSLRDELSQKIAAIENEKYGQLSRNIQINDLKEGAFVAEDSVTVKYLRAFEAYAQLKLQLDRTCIDQLTAL